tara:strand:+ start:297 stop:1376 length:1080 start_codon:yes stop_codon:yes gene_type:complete
MSLKHCATLAGAFLLLLNLQSVLAEQKTETYQGFFQGESCKVTINWADYSGQGQIDGRIITTSGIILPFFGSNPRTGFLEIEIQGKQHQLNKARNGNSVSWTGQNLSFSLANQGGAIPPPPVNNPGQNQGFRKDYIGTWKGENFTAYLNFVPDSDPDVLYMADGGLMMGGIAYPLSAWQPRADYFELSIETDPENHKMSKEVNSGRTSWVGRWVSMTENSAGGGVAGTIPGLPNPPTGRPQTIPPTHVSPMPIPPRQQPAPNPPAAGNAVWVIACEAQASQSGAEADAAEWKNRGFQADILWIPDYSSLSGAQMWLTYVGIYDYQTGKTQGISDLNQVRRHYPDAFGIKLDQSGRRETF